MKSTTNRILSTFLLLSTLQHHVVESFMTSPSKTRNTASVLNMAPKFDSQAQKWVPSSEEESSAADYPAWRSLLRHGPKAFLTRVAQPEQYDQAVLKFMAMDGVERWEAMGNMDRCNENSQDWTFERLEATKKGFRLDYVTLEPKQIGLSLIWTGIVFWFASDLVDKVVNN